MEEKIKALESKVTELENRIAKLEEYINEDMRYDYLRRNELCICNFNPGDYMDNVVTMDW